MRMIVFSVLTVLIGLVGAVHGNPKVTVKKDASITVEEYDPKTRLFVIAIKGEASGPNYVMPEDLRKAIAFEGGSADFMKQKGQMTGSVYQLRAPLPLLTEAEVLRRAKKALKEENK